MPSTSMGSKPKDPNAPGSIKTYYVVAKVIVRLKAASPDQARRFVTQMMGGGTEVIDAEVTELP